MQIKYKFTVLLTGLLIFTGTVKADSVKKEETKTFKMNKGGLIHLSANEGEVIIRGWDKDEVKLHMVKRAWGRGRREAEARLEEIEVAIRENSNRLMIREIVPEHQGSVNVFRLFDRDFWEEEGWHSQVVDFELWVPRQVNLRIKGDESDVDISEVEGKVTVDVDEGDVMLADVRSEEMQIRLDEGDVTLIDCESTDDGLLKVDSDEGRITLRNGRFHEVDLASDEGSLIVDAATIQRFWLSTDEGDVEAFFIPSKGGSYRIEADEGDIEIGLPEASKLQVRLIAEEGHVESAWNLRIRDLDDGESAEGRINGGNNAQLKAVSEEGDIFIRKSR